jgi:hypothetical protein
MVAVQCRSIVVLCLELGRGRVKVLYATPVAVGMRDVAAWRARKRQRQVINPSRRRGRGAARRCTLSTATGPATARVKP